MAELMKAETRAETSLVNVDITKPEGLQIAESMLKHYITDPKGGIKTIGEGIILLNRARELHLPLSMCFEHIHIINGKTGVDVHICKAMLSRAGVIHKWINRYTPLYEYTDGINAFAENRCPEWAVKVKSKDEAAKVIAKDGTVTVVYPVECFSDVQGNVYKSYQLNRSKTAMVVVANANMAMAHLTNKLAGMPIFRVANQPIDYESRVEFTRVYANGIVRKEEYEFSWSDAARAGLTDKDVWQKYPQVMLANRVYVMGARDIAPDIMYGMLETTELKIVEDVHVDDADVIAIA
jgi:hypothetical protein